VQYQGWFTSTTLWPDGGLPVVVGGGAVVVGAVVVVVVVVATGGGPTIPVRRGHALVLPDRLLAVTRKWIEEPRSARVSFNVSPFAPRMSRHGVAGFADRQRSHCSRNLIGRVPVQWPTSARSVLPTTARPTIFGFSSRRGDCRV
jgi:hypothetical protein